MKFRLLCCVLFLTVHILGLAQESGSKQIENDYQNFKETFKQEFPGLDSSKPSNKIAVHPVQLPEWLSEIPDSHGNCIYAIGISDPGMKLEEAIELAVLRAKVIIALLHNANISSITDHYSNEITKESADKFVTKYVNYYQLFATLPVQQKNFQTIDQYFNSFGEAIVLMKYTPDLKTISEKDSVLLKIDIYQAERQQSNQFEFEEKCEMYGLSKHRSSDEDIDIFYYFFRSFNQFYEIVSRYNGIELVFPQNLFRYQSLNTSGSTAGHNSISCKLTNGLWKAYLQSILQSYTLSFEEADMKVSQLGDTYSSSAQNLSRELVTVSPNFRISGLHIDNNRLSVIIKIADFKH